jgi:hypothetical protein
MINNILIVIIIILIIIIYNNLINENENNIDNFTNENENNIDNYENENNIDNFTNENENNIDNYENENNIDNFTNENENNIDNFTNKNENNIDNFTNKNENNIEEKQEITCSRQIKSSCTSKDNVNDPAYNMKNIIIQNILLEEHLAAKNKYCEPCIIKHFLHIIGLGEEAVWMAGENNSKYPLLDTCVDFYTDQFNKWYKNKNNKLLILGALRKKRQELIELYYFSKTHLI